MLADSAAVDFAANAFIHLKAIAFSEAARPLLNRAGVKNDDGVVPTERGGAAFSAAAATRQWAREARVRPPLRVNHVFPWERQFTAASCTTHSERRAAHKWSPPTY